jgi:L-ascorbate metabolism protein UlaG (beta-lactamase superfamily)
MYITYHGYTCFKIQSSQKITIITDIFDKSVGMKPPAPKAEILTFSCDHYDSKNILNGQKDNLPFIINSSGEYEISGVMIDGIFAKHGESSAKESFDTTIYKFLVDDISICHLGDMGQKELNEKQLDSIGDVDILLTPVGGTYLLDYKSAAHIVNQIEPRIIVPMGYGMKDLKLKLDSVDLFLKEIGISPKESVDKLKIAKKDLPQEDTEVIIFSI